MTDAYPKCQLPAGVEVEMSLYDWSGNLGPTRGVILLARIFPISNQMAEFGTESYIQTNRVWRRIRYYYCYLARREFAYECHKFLLCEFRFPCSEQVGEDKMFLVI